MKTVSALAAILAAVAMLGRPALAVSGASAGFSVAVTCTTTASVRIGDAGARALAVSANVSRSSGGATIVAVYAYDGASGDRTLVLQPAAPKPDGALVIDAHLDRAAVAAGAASDRIVIASAT